MCENFSNIQKPIDAICIEQENLLTLVLNGMQLNDEQKSMAGVVALGECLGEPHLFHQVCVEEHFKSMKSGNAQVQHYKCVGCQKTYGTRTGEMPPGTMTWWIDHNLLL